jgi:hypothetical protein
MTDLHTQIVSDTLASLGPDHTTSHSLSSIDKNTSSYDERSDLQSPNNSQPCKDKKMLRDTVLAVPLVFDFDVVHILQR